MSEEIPKAEGTEGAATEATPAPKDERTAEDKLREALAKQGAEYKAEIEELRKFKAAHESAQKKKEEEEAKARGEFERLLAERDAKMEELTASIARRDRESLLRDAGDRLRDLGMEDPLRRKGALIDLPADATPETLDAWIADFAKANPSAFVAPSRPVKQPGVGSPAGGGDTLEARLASSDPKVKEAALLEQLRQQIGF